MLILTGNSTMRKKDFLYTIWIANAPTTNEKANIFMSDVRPGQSEREKLRTHIFICQEYKRLHILVYTKKQTWEKYGMIECLTQIKKNKCKINHFLFFYQICLLIGKYTYTIITGLRKYTDLTNTQKVREREIRDPKVY